MCTADAKNLMAISTQEQAAPVASKGSVENPHNLYMEAGKNKVYEDPDVLFRKTMLEYEKIKGKPMSPKEAARLKLEMQEGNTEMTWLDGSKEDTNGLAIPQ